MINDIDTNFLYLADCLPKKYPSFYSELLNAIDEAEIAFDFLPNCKDVWVKDFMPIHRFDNTYSMFEYNPDYLQEKKWKATISDVHDIAEQLGLTFFENDILLDGGNVIKVGNYAVCCDKVISEFSRGKSTRCLNFENTLQSLALHLGVDKILLIPTHPIDFTGHADGVLRYINEQTVFINKYSDDPKLEPSNYSCKLKIALHNIGLKYITMPYNPYQNSRDDDATGLYINYLQVGDAILLPQFNLPEDEEAIQTIKINFPDCRIYPVRCNELAKDGGVLNCIGWQVKLNSN